MSLTAGRIVLLIFAIILVIASIGLLIGGGFILAFDTGFKDSEGYYSTGSIPIESTSSAIITYPSDFQDDAVWYRNDSSQQIPNTPEWYWENHTLSIKVEASSVISNKPIFIGVAREADLNNYLQGVSYDKFEDFSMHPYKVRLTQITGDKLPAAPSQQTFWVASASGTGTQTLKWDITSGSYSLVLMNADGSSSIDARVALGIKIPEVLRSVGIGLLVGGIIFLIISGLMIYFALHGRRSISPAIDS
jgi:hypothetical protein